MDTSAAHPPTSPHGIAVQALFYGHGPAVIRDYANASKVKTLDIHPFYPWVVTADEVGRQSVNIAHLS